MFSSKGKGVSNPHPHLEIFLLCERFGWTPSEALQQDPVIIDSLFLIMSEQARHQKEEMKEAERGSGTKTRKKTYIGKDGG